MNTKRLSLFLFNLARNSFFQWTMELAFTVWLLCGCTTIQLPNIEVCAVSAQMSAGADCARTLSDETSEKNLDEWIDFLEPKENPERGAALCMSSEDFSKLKTALDQACEKLGKVCSKDAKEKLFQASERMSRLQKRVAAKIKKKKI